MFTWNLTQLCIIVLNQQTLWRVAEPGSKAATWIKVGKRGKAGPENERRHERNLNSRSVFNNLGPETQTECHCSRFDHVSRHWQLNSSVVSMAQLGLSNSWKNQGNPPISKRHTAPLYATLQLIRTRISTMKNCGYTSKRKFVRICIFSFVSLIGTFCDLQNFRYWKAYSYLEAKNSNFANIYIQ